MNKEDIEQLNIIVDAKNLGKDKLDEKIFYLSTGLIVFSITLANWFEDPSNTKFLVMGWVFSMGTIILHLAAYKFCLSDLQDKKKIVYDATDSRRKDFNLFAVGLKRSKKIACAEFCDTLAEGLLIPSMFALLCFSYLNL